MLHSSLAFGQIYTGQCRHTAPKLPLKTHPDVQAIVFFLFFSLPMIIILIIIVIEVAVVLFAIIICTALVEWNGFVDENNGSNGSNKSGVRENTKIKSYNEQCCHVVCSCMGLCVVYCIWYGREVSLYDNAHRTHWMNRLNLPYVRIRAIAHTLFCRLMFYLMDRAAQTDNAIQTEWAWEREREREWTGEWKWEMERAKWCSKWLVSQYGRAGWLQSAFWCDHTRLYSSNIFNTFH